MGIRRLVITALEIRRMYSEATALDIADRLDFQRERSNARDWHDWALLFLKPEDMLSPERRLCLYALHTPPKDNFWGNREMQLADEALDLFERYYDRMEKRRLVEQGYNIAAKLAA